MDLNTVVKVQMRFGGGSKGFQHGVHKTFRGGSDDGRGGGWFGGEQVLQRLRVEGVLEEGLKEVLKRVLKVFGGREGLTVFAGG